MKKHIKYWAIVDKRTNSLCYADKKRTKRYNLGFIATFFKKPSIKSLNLGSFKEYKKIVKINIVIK